MVEDLITGMPKQLGNICKELGLHEIQQEQLHKAEENNSFEKLAKKEKQKQLNELNLLIVEAKSAHCQIIAKRMHLKGSIKLAVNI